MMITNEEKDIIIKARNTADTFGLCRLSLAKDNIIDEGYIWTNEHEMFVFNLKDNI
jgi:hypothetical protein